jgi:hypothetical protein
MRLWIWTITNVTVLVTVGVTEAAAPVNLIWNAPPDCPGRDAVAPDFLLVMETVAPPHVSGITSTRSLNP